MAIASRTWTYADLADWPEENGKLVEIIDGELIETPAPIPPHQLLTMELVFDFGEVVRPGRLGRLFTAPTDVLLPDGGVVQPDLVFVRSDRLGIVGKAAIEGPRTSSSRSSPPRRGRGTSAARRRSTRRSACRSIGSSTPSDAP